MLSGLASLRQSRLARCLFYAVAKRGEGDAVVGDALALFSSADAAGAGALTRDDVERVLLENGDVPLRACDELCDAWEALALDGTGDVSPTAFAAGVLALRRDKSRSLVLPVLVALDEERSGRVSVEALVATLAASASARDSAGARVADGTAEAEIRALIAALLDADARAGAESLPYDAVLDLLLPDAEGHLV